MRIRIVDAGRTTIVKIAQTLGSASIADGSITTAKLADEAVTLAKLAEDVTSELGGVSVHGDLTGRDAADSHPTSAITGLDAALAAKATPSDISTAIAAIPSDGAAGVASLRTLGTGATQAAAGATVEGLVHPSAATETGTTRTLSDSDNGKIIVCTHASGCTATVPNTLTAGFSCVLVRNTAGDVAFQAGSGVTFIKPASSSTNPKAYENGSQIGVTMLSTTSGLIGGAVA